MIVRPRLGMIRNNFISKNRFSEQVLEKYQLMNAYFYHGVSLTYLKNKQDSFGEVVTKHPVFVTMQLLYQKTFWENHTSILVNHRLYHNMIEKQLAQSMEVLRMDYREVYPQFKMLEKQIHSVQTNQERTEIQQMLFYQLERLQGRTPVFPKVSETLQREISNIDRQRELLHHVLEQLTKEEKEILVSYLQKQNPEIKLFSIENFQTQNLQTEQMQTETLSIENFQTRQMQAETLSIENFQTKQMQAETLSIENFRIENAQMEYLQAQTLPIELFSMENLHKLTDKQIREIHESLIQRTVLSMFQNEKKEIQSKKEVSVNTELEIQNGLYNRLEQIMESYYQEYQNRTSPSGLINPSFLEVTEEQQQSKNHYSNIQRELVYHVLEQINEEERKELFSYLQKQRIQIDYLQTENSHKVNSHTEILYKENGKKEDSNNKEYSYTGKPDRENFYTENSSKENPNKEHSYIEKSDRESFYTENNNTKNLNRENSHTENRYRENFYTESHQETSNIEHLQEEKILIENKGKELLQSLTNEQIQKIHEILLKGDGIVASPESKTDVEQNLIQIIENYRQEYQKRVLSEYDNTNSSILMEQSFSENIEQQQSKNRYHNIQRELVYHVLEQITEEEKKELLSYLQRQSIQIDYLQNDLPIENTYRENHQKHHLPTENPQEESFYRESQRDILLQGLTNEQIQKIHEALLKGDGIFDSAEIETNLEQIIESYRQDYQKKLLSEYEENWKRELLIEQISYTEQSSLTEPLLPKGTGEQQNKNRYSNIQRELVYHVLEQINEKEKKELLSYLQRQNIQIDYLQTENFHRANYNTTSLQTENQQKEILYTANRYREIFYQEKDKKEISNREHLQEANLNREILYKEKNKNENSNREHLKEANLDRETFYQEKHKNENFNYQEQTFYKENLQEENLLVKNNEEEFLKSLTNEQIQKIHETLLKGEGISDLSEAKANLQQIVESYRQEYQKKLLSEYEESWKKEQLTDQTLYTPMSSLTDQSLTEDASEQQSKNYYHNIQRELVYHVLQQINEKEREELLSYLQKQKIEINNILANNLQTEDFHRENHSIDNLYTKNQQEENLLIQNRYKKNFLTENYQEENFDTQNNRKETFPIENQPEANLHMEYRREKLLHNLTDEQIQKIHETLLKSEGIFDLSASEISSEQNLNQNLKQNLIQIVENYQQEYQRRLLEESKESWQKELLTEQTSYIRSSSVIEQLFTEGTDGQPIKNRYSSTQRELIYHALEQINSQKQNMQSVPVQYQERKPFLITRNRQLLPVLQSEILERPYSLVQQKKQLLEMVRNGNIQEVMHIFRYLSGNRMLESQQRVAQYSDEVRSVVYHQVQKLTMDKIEDISEYVTQHLFVTRELSVNKKEYSNLQEADIVFREKESKELERKELEEVVEQYLVVEKNETKQIKQQQQQTVQMLSEQSEELQQLKTKLKEQASMVEELKTKQSVAPLNRNELYREIMGKMERQLRLERQRRGLD